MGQKLGDALALAVADLTLAGVDTPILDAEILFGNVLGLSRAEIVLQKQRNLTVTEIASLQKVINLRRNRMPVARIIGKRGFYKGEFLLSSDTLEPRPDSETLIDAVLKDWRNIDRDVRVLDLGTGSGCLLISILTDLSLATGVGVDLAGGAVSVACENAQNNQVGERAEFIRASWMDRDAMIKLGKFDVIIANPPYIPNADVALLKPEVKNYDPKLALFGGRDGLLAFRQIADILPNLLVSDGAFYTEIGKGQEKDVIDIFSAVGFTLFKQYSDLNNIIRVLKFSR